MRIALAYAPLIALAAACTGTVPKTDTNDTDSGLTTPPVTEDWQPVSYVDEGEVCFTQGDPDVNVTVTVQDCMSSSCSRAFAGSCTVTVDGTDITVTSDLHWEDNVADNASCTDDCGIPSATCTLPALADGTYQVTIGGTTTTLVVPITEPCPYYM